MVRSSAVFGVAIVLLAIASKTHQYDLNNCVTGKNDEKVCSEIPSYYNEYTNAMNASLRENYEFLNTWHGEDLEEAEYDNFGSEFNCQSVTKVKSPYLYLEKDKNKKLIVQTDIFKQKIQTTECVMQKSYEMESEKSECFTPLAVSWRGKCETKYAAIDLVLYDIDKQTIEKLAVELPVCCYCSIYK